MAGVARLWMLVVTAALIAHLAIEGLYWQMAPAYVGCVLLALTVLFASRLKPMFPRIAGGVACFLLFASALALVVLPKFRLPQPTGPYAIGTRIVHLTDASRSDPDFPSGHRELMVQVWYPAANASGPLAPYRRALETTWLSSYDATIATHSHLDAPVLRSAGPRPVLLFNPAWQGQRTQNTFQTEELASHGFVVIAIDHTHNSEPVAFPDGRVVASSEIRDIVDFDGVSYEEQLNFGSREVKEQARDDSFVLDEFTRMASDDSSDWHGALDLSRVGALGHSFGGAVSVQAALQDSRIRAAMNMDGWIFGDLWHRNLNKPLMVMYEDPYPPPSIATNPKLKTADRNTQLGAQLDAEDVLNVQRSLAACGGYRVVIAQTLHFNFADRALYSPIRSLTDSGKIAPEQAMRIINTYTVAFFEESLKDENQPLLHRPSPYGEVRFEDWPRQSTCSTESTPSPGSE